MSINLTFLGAAGTVTGSKFLLAIHEHQYLFDCGLFQGAKEWREKNWTSFPSSPQQLRAVFLSHVHLDHCGYLPRLVKQGFRGPIYCTKATAELLSLMLTDSAHIQEEDARYANFKGYSKHQPAVPLYTGADVHNTLPLVKIHQYGEAIELDHHLSVRFHPNGHLLGSAWMECTAFLKRQPVKIYFSGDLGRYHDDLMQPPVAMSGAADYVVMESTYGDKIHPTVTEARNHLGEIINRTLKRGGTTIIPAFAVGRTPVILFQLRKLEEAGLIPTVPVYVDSPMATDSTEIYAKFGTELNLQVNLLESKGHRSPLRCNKLHYIKSPDESKALNDNTEPSIIISASGMASGGRILHHLVRRLPDPRHTVLLVGYQAQGTRGWHLQQGAKEVKIHGKSVAVNAEIAMIDGLSAHGDQTDLIRWLKTLSQKPKTTFLVHGESDGFNGLSEKLEHDGYSTHIPEYRETVTLA